MIDIGYVYIKYGDTVARGISILNIQFGIVVGIMDSKWYAERLRGFYFLGLGHTMLSFSIKQKSAWDTYYVWRLRIVMRRYFNMKFGRMLSVEWDGQRTLYAIPQKDMSYQTMWKKWIGPIWRMT